MVSSDVKFADNDHRRLKRHLFGYLTAENAVSHLTEDQIKHMVDRFLGWKLPGNFNPDGGISYTRLPYHDKTPPSGTNLFDATQADAMVRYMVEGIGIAK